MAPTHCAICRGKYSKVIYRGLPVRMCDDRACNSLAGFWSRITGRIPMDVEDAGSVVMRYDGGYLSVLWRGLLSRIMTECPYCEAWLPINADCFCGIENSGREEVDMAPVPEGRETRHSPDGDPRSSFLHPDGIPTIIEKESAGKVDPKDRLNVALAFFGM